MATNPIQVVDAPNVSAGKPNRSSVLVTGGSASGSAYTTEVARDLSGIPALRNDWESLATDPNGDLDFYVAVIQSHKEIVRPHIIVLRQGDAVRSIVLGRLEVKPLQIAVGYKKISTPPLRFLMVIHGGVLGLASDEHAALIMSEIDRSLRSNEADVVWFHGVDPHSAFFRAAKSAGWLVCRDLFPTPLTRWRRTLPSNYQELLRQLSSNTRHNLKRYSNRLRDAYGEQLSVRSFRQTSEVETILADSEAVAAQTYHRGLRVGFVSSDETRRLAMLAADRGWLRAHILYIAGMPSAFWNGFLYRRTFYTWTTGFLPELSELRPGTFLLQKMMNELCTENAADQIDFGFGDAQYKRDWCDRGECQSSFLLFAPSIKGIAVNCLRTPLLGASIAARSLIARTGALQRLKKAWRTQLASRHQGQASRG